MTGNSDVVANILVRNLNMFDTQENILLNGDKVNSTSKFGVGYSLKAGGNIKANTSGLNLCSSVSPFTRWSSTSVHPLVFFKIY